MKEISADSTKLRHLRHLRHLVWLLVPLFLWWTLRSIDLSRVLQTLSRLIWWQLGLLVLINALAILMFGLRWWLIVRNIHRDLSIRRLAGYWLSGFAVDYITPAPGLGGEPVLIALLHERDELKPSEAAAAVALDRFVDATVNFTVLLSFALLILRWHIFHHHLATRAILAPAGLLLALLVLIGAMLRGHLPFHWLAQRLPSALQQTGAIQFLVQSEARAAHLLQHYPRGVLNGALATLLIWIVLLADYWLLIFFLGTRLTMPELITAVTAYRLAFLLPVPGGLGALEASQVFAFRVLGLQPAVGLSGVLIVRARDLIFAAAGLLWSSWLIGGWSRLRQKMTDQPPASS